VGTKGIEDYPGKRPPKNRTTRKPKKLDDPFFGVKSSHYVIKGERVEVFTIGQLAKVLGKKTGTVRSWETKGIIPKPIYRTAPPNRGQLPGVEAKGRRIYTRKQVDLIVLAVNTILEGKDPRVVTSDNWNKLKQYIKDNWKK